MQKTSDISKEIKEFDNALSDLRKIRNVLEHIDEYRLGKGHSKIVKPSALQTIVIDDNRIEWLGYEIQMDDALQLSGFLFQAIQNNAPEAYLKKISKG